MNFKKIVFPFFVFLFLFGSLSAKEIEIKESKLSLFNKEVTGFRFTLDRSIKTVTSNILKHLSGYKEKPFDFEKNIILENTLYPPISESREISIYYLLRDVPGGATEVSVVVMYSYKQSVNSTDFPEMTQKLMVDLANLFTKLGNDTPKFNGYLYNESGIADLESQSSKSKENPIVEHFKEEEVPNSKVILNEKAVSETNSSLNSDQGDLPGKIKRLEVKEKELKQTNKGLRDQIATLSIEKQKVGVLESKNQTLRDSLTLVKNKFENLSPLNIAGDELSTSNEDAAKIKVLETNLKNTKSKLEKNQVLLDSLNSKQKLNIKKVKMLSAENDKFEKSLVESRNKNARVKADFLAFKDKMKMEGKVNMDPELEQENKELRAKIQGLDANSSMGNTGFSGKGDANMKAENEKLKAELKNALASLKEIKGSSESTLNKMDNYQGNLGDIKDDLKSLKKELKASATQVVQYEDSLQQKKKEIKKLNRENTQIRADRIKEDQLRKDEISLLGSQLKTYQKKSDSLSKLAGDPMGKFNAEELERQKRYFEANLSSDIQIRKQEIEDKEKLVDQRTLATEERLKKAQALERKYKDITEKEYQLKLAEQKLKNKGVYLDDGEIENNSKGGNSGVKKVSKEKITYGGEEIPVFSATTNLTYKETERKIVGYLLKKGFLFDEKFPNLEYDGLMLRSISLAPLTVTFRLKPIGPGTIVTTSFRFQDGHYIDHDTNPQVVGNIERLILDLFDFSF